MILCMDIGNTNITMGGFAGDDLAFVARMATDTAATEDEYASRILSILNMHGAGRRSIEGAIVSSVVPQLNQVVRQALRFAYGVEALMVGPGIRTGLNIRCDDPSSVGADLICASVAAYRLYGGPSLVVDLGTATKLLVVDQNGAFIGASIAPGVGIALRALSEGTAQLPQISLEAPRSVLGRNTVDCMRSGVIFGNACMIDGMIDRISAEMGRELPVCATGGLAPVILPYCRHAMTPEPDLVLWGLHFIYQKNKK